MTTGASIAESTLKPKNLEGLDFTNSPLTEKVKASAHKIIDEIAVKFAKTENDLRSKTSTIDEVIDDVIEAKEDILNKDFQGNMKRTQEFVQKHPVVSLGLAIGVGYLLSNSFKD